MHPNLDALRGYRTYANVVTTVRGTALVTREEITLSNVTRLSSGRGIAAECRGIWMVNIYAPSGAARRQERKHSYNSELAYLVRDSPSTILVGGDFNCVLDKADATGDFN